MDLNDSQKYKGRVKMRNLDPKLQGLLGKSVQSGTIEMKDFSPEFQNIITRILNTGSSGAGYNDTELRQKIGSLDYNKADKAALKNYFNKNTDHVSYEMMQNDVATKIQNAAASSDLPKYRLKADAISYEDLDSKLKVKIDNASKAGGSGSGEGGTIDEANIIKINERLNQHDTGIQANAKNITTLTNRMDALGNTDTLKAMPAQIQSNAQNIQRLTDSFNDLIGANDPNNKEPGHFGFNRLTSEVQNQIKVGTTALDSVNKLKTSVDKNTGDITSISSKVDNASKTASDANTQAAKNTKDISNINATLTDRVNGIDGKVNTMTLDDILNHSLDTVTAGKIQETHLSDTIKAKLNKADTLKKEVDEAKTIAENSRVIVGTVGQFAYKGANANATKSILYRIYLYPTTIDIMTLEDNETHLAGCITSNKLMEFRDGRWNEVAQGFLNEKYCYAIYYDLSSHKFYYHDGAAMDELPAANTNLVELVVPARSSADWIHGMPQKAIKSITMLDTDQASRTYNMYINAESTCTFAFNDQKMTAFNDTEENVTLQIAYND